MRKETVFIVSVEEETGTPFPTQQKETESEKIAIELAKEWAEEYQTDYVYIRYYQASDEQQGYLNPNGYGTTEQDWASEYK